MAEKVKKAVKPGMPDEKAAKEAAKATLLAMTKTDAQKAAAIKPPASVAVKTPSGAAVKVEEKPVMVAAKVEAAKAPAVKEPAAVEVKSASVAAVKVEEKPVMVAQKVDAAKAPVGKPDVPRTEASKVEPVKAPISKSAPNAEAAKAEPAKAAAAEDAPKAESKKEADPTKEFVDGIMTEMSLKGGSKKRLIKMLAEQFNFDKQKVMFRLKRALITERYAAAHAEAGH